MAVNHVKAHPKGTVLFSSGDVATAVYFILDGTIIASNGDQQVVLGAGGILGDVAFFKESKHTYTAICASDVKVLMINKSNGSQVVAGQPLIALSLLRELALQIPKTDQLQFFQGLEEAEA